MRNAFDKARAVRVRWQKRKRGARALAETEKTCVYSSF